MFRNLFVAAVLAALCAGLVFSIVQSFRLTPLILAAETYEVPEEPVAATTTEHAAAGRDAVEWMPQEGFERTAYTILANFLTAAGYALLIGAASVILGIPITAANGLLWAAAGFSAFMLAPSFGLPPGLPGMPVANTLARQMWWWTTALSTAAALVLLAKNRAAWAIGVAAALIVAPHLIAAPQPPADPSAVPPRLAGNFVAAVLFASAAMWAVLGLSFGWISDRLTARARTSAPATAKAHA